MKRCSSKVIRAAGSAALAAGLLSIASPAMATSNAMADWRDTYPNSNSDDSGCQLCHGNSLGQLNAYGKAMCDKFVQDGTIPSEWQQTFGFIEGFDSDFDGSDNGLEIDNDTQPGWTEGANPLYTSSFDDGCPMVQSDSTVPSGVPLPYDIPANGDDPVANPNGPYMALVGEIITFDGTGSYDNDDGTIVQYDWAFGDGGTMIDAGPNPEYAYEEEGVYPVVLTVTDDDGNTDAAATTATISPLYLLDLDIADFSVSGRARVGKSIGIELSVKNNGDVLGQAIATVTGVQGGVEVYRQRLNVYDYFGKKATSFEFSPYTPTVAGDILFTVTIADEDPDEDMTTATSKVK